MMSRGPHRVAVLALPAVIPLELGIAAEIFGRDPHYRLTVCADGRSAPLPGSGLTVNTPAGLEGLERADTLIIPGYEDADATVSTAVLDAIRAAHARGARLVSICTAAFALAAAGVLDDRPATTHWRWTAELQDRYPKIVLKAQSRRRSRIDGRSLGGIGRLLPGSNARVLVEAIQSRYRSGGHPRCTTRRL